MFETVVLLNIFGEPVILFHDLLKNTKLSSTEFIQHLFKKVIFSNNIKSLLYFLSV